MGFFNFWLFYLRIWKSYGEEKTKIEPPANGLFPRWLQWLALHHSQAKSLELHLGLSCGQHRSKHLGHHSLPFPPPLAHQCIEAEQLHLNHCHMGYQHHRWKLYQWVNYVTRPPATGHHALKLSIAYIPFLFDSNHKFIYVINYAYAYAIYFKKRLCGQ